MVNGSQKSGISKTLHEHTLSFTCIDILSTYRALFISLAILCSRVGDTNHGTSRRDFDLLITPSFVLVAHISQANSSEH